MLTDNRICLYCWIMPHLCIYSSILQYFNTYTVTFCVLWTYPRTIRPIPPLTNWKKMSNFIMILSSSHTSPWTGFELKTLVVIDTGSCKSNTNTISNKYCNNIMNCIKCLSLNINLNILGISSLLVSEEVGSTNLPIMYILNKMYCFSNTHNMSNLSWTCKYCSHYSSCVGNM
jgi:hypothetical protein